MIYFTNLTNLVWLFYLFIGAVFTMVQKQRAGDNYVEGKYWKISFILNIIFWLPIIFWTVCRYVLLRR